MAVAARQVFSQKLPNSNTRACWALALFIAVQIADGVLTAVGIGRFGPGIEANPILVHTMILFGSSAALCAAKSVAIAAGAVLHVYSYHLMLAILTVAYVFATLLPWTLLLN
jgi:hypothetical protein